MPPMEWIWLATLVIFAVIEASTSALVSLWFVGGALAALIAALFSASIGVQIALFLLVSALLLLSLRPLVRRFFTPKRVATNAQSNVGKVTVVLETVDNLQCTGMVRLSGVEWSARSADGSVLEVGTVVRVIRIEGVKVCVERAEK